eukprot:6154915-Alexandrium_andersonii.AAC.1
MPTKLINTTTPPKLSSPAWMTNWDYGGQGTKKAQTTIGASYLHAVTQMQYLQHHHHYNTSIPAR